VTEASEASLEELVEQRRFAGILQTHGEVFFRLSNTLSGCEAWNKKHYFQLINESDALESFLDDFGARYNRTYAFFTELIASLRGFAQTGYSITHLDGRLASYGSRSWPAEVYEGTLASLQRTKTFIRTAVERMLTEVRTEANQLGVEITPEAFPEANFLPVTARRRLPRNVGQAELVDEEQRIAEVASSYLATCDELGEVHVRQIDDVDERRTFLAQSCDEARARNIESRVHNLQSTYDTHIQNTVLEAKDERLRRLRGHASAALHLLEAVTRLTHFVERHEDELRSEEAQRRIGSVVGAAEVQGIVLNDLLYWANGILQSGWELAEDLLPSYTNVQDVTVALPEGVTFHARPASLIVGIVNRYGTPVELELGGKRCNAGSILELLVTAGSNTSARSYTFRGDERPLKDIGLLFEHRLGEDGIDLLPPELSYLRSGS